MQIMRRVFLLLFVSFVSFCSFAAAADRPNILFIFSDDQNPRTIGCYPQSWPWVRTPNIDTLAKGGIRFQHCYLGSWCMPSRANLLTGRYPRSEERRVGKEGRSRWSACA